MFLREIYLERKKIFENYLEYAKKIKESAKKELGDDIKVYIFGSVVEGRFSIGLSDIDIAIVTKEEVKNKAEVVGKILKGIEGRNVFEIHIITERKFNEWYKRFVKKFIEI